MHQHAVLTQPPVLLRLRWHQPSAALSAAERQRRGRANLALVQRQTLWFSDRHDSVKGERLCGARCEFLPLALLKLSASLLNWLPKTLRSRTKNVRTFADATRQQNAARQANLQRDRRSVNRAPIAEANREFPKQFTNNPFGFACTVR